MTRLQEMAELVKQEAANLRKHATEEELESLNINTLDYASSYHCVYGQITGYCFSDRANELIQLCCPKTYRPDITDQNHILLNAKLNGSPDDIRESCNGYYSYYSPIEVFISQNYDHRATNNKLLVNYLLGHGDELVFEGDAHYQKP